MGDTLESRKLVVRWSWRLAVLFFGLVVSSPAYSQQHSLFTAHEIIQILQESPELLADAKTQIVAALRDRGYPVTERDITDDRLFSTIQTDDRARQLLSDELKKRGYVPKAAATDQYTQPQHQTPPKGATERDNPDPAPRHPRAQRPNTTPASPT